MTSETASDGDGFDIVMERFESMNCFFREKDSYMNTLSMDGVIYHSGGVFSLIGTPFKVVVIERTFTYEDSPQIWWYEDDFSFAVTEFVNDLPSAEFETIIDSDYLTEEILTELYFNIDLFRNG